MNNSPNDRRSTGAAVPRPLYMTLAQAAEMYSVSVDWLRRNKRIPKFKASRRLVRVRASDIEEFFLNHEV